ncbi:MAG: TadE/TadG family type IV pilus assembly protein [Armatimonadota bacterium]
MVELAIALPLLLFIILGIIEFGVMFGNYLELGNVAREGARSAALGSNTSIVTSRIYTTATNVGMVSANDITSTLEYRVYDKNTHVWTGWSTLTNDRSGYNSAPCDEDYDSQVRVTVSYKYPLVTGGFFGTIIGNDGKINLTASSVMRREETP